jgi:tetratricopeptide (TPR) repeat protein
MMLATVYLDIRLDDMAAQLTKAAELGFNNPSIQIRAGHRLWNIDDLGGARRCAARASDSIGMADLEGLIGHIAASDGQYAVAEEKLRSARQREPEYPTHAIGLARFLWARGRGEDALIVIDEALDHVREDDKDFLERLRREITDEAQ